MRTFSASCSSKELECVFFSVTPTCGSVSRMALLLTSSSRARSLIRTLLIRPFVSPRCDLGLHLDLTESIFSTPSNFASVTFLFFALTFLHSVVTMRLSIVCCRMIFFSSRGFCSYGHLGCLIACSFRCCDPVESVRFARAFGDRFFRNGFRFWRGGDCFTLG